ncbi:MAG TPA: hypothetical protein PLI09_20975 [Candidatus Hydrogenedentes bacterium]|nr:hypothetical protein [Candidatus Hydrogenedentota bacterium]
MKVWRYFFFPHFLAVLGVLSVSALARPAPQGLWEFDNPDAPLAASAGNPLELVGSHSVTAGIQGGDGAVTIGPGSYYRCVHGFAASGGGKVNAYTLIVDLKVDSFSSLHSLLQPDPANTADAVLSINLSGQAGGPGMGYATTSLPTSQWFRIAMVVNLEGPGGAVDLYVNGTNCLHTEPSFWDTVSGSDDIREDGPFALAPASDASPYALFFADNDGGDGIITVSSVALYDHALLSEEVAGLGGPDRKYLLPNVPDAKYVMYDEFLTLPSGQYKTIFVSGIKNVLGYLRLEDVVMDKPGEPTSIREGFFGFFGQIITMSKITRTENGYRTNCLFQMPGFLGGMKEGVDFTFTDNSCTILGGHFELPDIVNEGVEIKRVYLDFHPDTGTYGGGGIVKLPTWGNGIGGSLELKDGLGPEINGVRLPDITKINLTATGLNIPVGEVFTLYSLGGGIANEYGISNPVNWGNSTLSATMKIVVKPNFTIGGRTYFLYAFDAVGSFSIHDGSLKVDGTGLLMNTITTNTVHAYYDPPYYFDIGASFNALDIFTGSFDAGVSASGFHGDLRGTIGIPVSVPVVGGWTFADAHACLANTEFEGSLDVVLTPAIPSICTPEICFPALCFSWWSCDNTCWAWIFPYPCDCYWHSSCWTPPCIPQVCTPAIPAVKVHFGFRFEAASGDFEWTKHGPYNPWEIPIEAPIKTGAENGGFYVLTNWWTEDSASTHPIRSAQKNLGISKNGTLKADYFIDSEVPAALFRLNYENTEAAKVDMTVATPEGKNLNSANGALPTGFDNHLGYSRFNPDSREQVIVLLNPVQGAYTVTVNNSAELGNFTVDMMLQDEAPWGEITSIAPGEEKGTYEISWEDHDSESSPLVRLFLDHDRSGSDGFLVATLHESGNMGAYTLDSSALNVNAGDYFVRLEVDDGVNAPFSFHSHDTISVVPDGAPEPVTNIQFLPDDGKFHISWEPSPTPDLLGYLVLYKEADEDLGQFNHRFFVSTEEVALGATIDGLLNDDALLVTVVAVDTEHRHSYPADIVRIIPHAPGANTVPHIVSTPNQAATATFPYTYLPTLSDVNFGTYVWSLDTAPDTMLINAECGLITWTPGEEEEGAHAVTVRLTKNGDPALSDTQSFEVHVYPPQQVNGLEEHAYQIASAPVVNATTVESDTAEKCTDGTGNTYEYQVLVHGPTSDLHYELAAGPDGMKINPDTGLITWNMPRDAKGDWVRVLITAEGKYQLEQDFYLHVHRPSHLPGATKDENEEGEGSCWDRLFGCRAAEANAGPAKNTDGLGEYLLLAGIVTLACFMFKKRIRAKLRR